MRFTLLILEGFTRIGLSGIKRLEWHPEAPYQIILGTNGSGKSSLMGELSPLPPVPGDFVKGGLKHVELEHEGSQYVLKSHIGTSVKHSFVRNGVELNDGGTGVIQYELVKQYFKYTKERHALLTGRKGSRFSEMSQAERRKWITEMSSADYTYAFALFDRLRTSLRDMDGVLKHVRRRLNDETATLNGLSEDANIEERVKMLQEELTDYLYSRQPHALNVDDAREHLHEGVASLEASGTAVETIASRIAPRGRFRDTIALESVLATLENEETRYRTLLDRLQHEYSDTEALRHSFENEEVTDEASVRRRLQELEQEAFRAQDEIERFGGLFQLDDPRSVLQATDEILSSVMELFSQLPDNSDKKFSRENHQKATDRKRAIQGKLDDADQAIKAINQRLHAIDHARPETCPQCSYTWQPGVAFDEKQSLLDQREAHRAYCVRGEEVMAKVIKYLEESDQYMELYRRWRGYVSQYPRLQLLWDEIAINKYDLENPFEHNDVFHQWRREVESTVRLRKAQEETERLTKLLASAQQGGALKLTERMASIEAQMRETNNAWQKVREEKTALSVEYKLFQQLDQSVDRWNQAILSLEKAFEDAMLALVQDHVEKGIARTQGQLGALQHRLNERKVLLGVIADLTKQLDEAVLDHAALSVLVKEISPKEGFIADQIRGFIECFAAQLNSILSSVWSYELEVLPCDTTNGNLDYKFPMRCGTSGPTIDDVSSGSTSQADMIDFAFRQTAMLYLGLDQFPLYVDELGASFDEAHRPNVHQFVSRLMDSQRYSQVFLISHYVSGWSTFGDAEYLVLDSRNIAVPEPHNTHVVLT